jgi:hypothetical protein
MFNPFKRHKAEIKAEQASDLFKNHKIDVDFWEIVANLHVMHHAAEELLHPYQIYRAVLEEKQGRPSIKEAGEFIAARDKVVKEYELQENDVIQLLAYCAEMSIEAAQKEQGDRQ